LLKSIRVANIAKPQAIADLDNFDTFISAPPIEIDCTPLQWWCQPQQRQQYPHLSRIAIDILSIPAESVEPEEHFLEHVVLLYGTDFGSHVQILRELSVSATGCEKALSYLHTVVVWV
jgi:uncharacterized protein YheU (UPF0270 family)